MFKKLFSFHVPPDAEFQCCHDPVTGNVQLNSTTHGFAAAFRVTDEENGDLLEFCQDLDKQRIQAEKRRADIAAQKDSGQPESPPSE